MSTPMRRIELLLNSKWDSAPAQVQPQSCNADAVSPKTADLCDKYADVLTQLPPVFRDYGKILTFSGPAHTLKVFEDNAIVRSTLEKPGNGHVLVVDGGGSTRCALVGDQLATLGVKNGWAGIIVNGCIRDSGEIANMPIGVKALATSPIKSIKRGWGLAQLPIEIGGVKIVPGAWVYADEDGILITPKKLH